MKHELHIRMESRKGMIQPDYRIICSCGFVEKAISEDDAELVVQGHKREKGVK
jgi:hypothetical protein